MPLCPTCICSHMDMHIKEGKNTPKFDNINESFTNVSTEIKKFNERFEEARDKLTVVERTVLDQKKTLSDLIYNVKVQVREMVETSFDELEKDLVATVDKQNEILGLHVPETLEQLQKGIIEVSGKLREMVGDLRTDKALSTLITFNHETKSNIEKYQEVIFKEIKSNEEFAPIANQNYAAINRIKQAISQVVTLKFVFPEEMKKTAKTTTECSEVSSVTNLTQVSTPRIVGTGTNTPINKTCLNSLRSSFGGKKHPEVLTTNNRQTVVQPTPQKVVSPSNFRKFEPSVTSSFQGKQTYKPSEFRRVDAENRY